MHRDFDVLIEPFSWVQSGFTRARSFIGGVRSTPKSATTTFQGSRFGPRSHVWVASVGAKVCLQSPISTLDFEKEFMVTRPISSWVYFLKRTKLNEGKPGQEVIVGE